MGVFLAITDLASLLTAIGSVVTAVWVWVAAAFVGLEAALAASFIMQVLFGISAMVLTFSLVKKIIGIVKGFGKAK